MNRQAGPVKVLNTSAARSQYPLRKSMQMLVFAVTFLCKYGQSFLPHIPSK